MDAGAARRVPEALKLFYPVGGHAELDLAAAEFGVGSTRRNWRRRAGPMLPGKRVKIRWPRCGCRVIKS
jgi:hypothetical protein